MKKYIILIVFLLLGSNVFADTRFTGNIFPTPNNTGSLGTVTNNIAQSFVITQNTQAIIAKSSSISVSGNILPFSSEVNIGSSTQNFKNIYVSTTNSSIGVITTLNVTSIISSNGIKSTSGNYYIKEVVIPIIDWDMDSMPEYNLSIAGYGITTSNIIEVSARIFKDDMTSSWDFYTASSASLTGYAYVYSNNILFLRTENLRFDHPDYDSTGGFRRGWVKIKYF